MNIESGSFYLQPIKHNQGCINISATRILFSQNNKVPSTIAINILRINGANSTLLPTFNKSSLNAYNYN